MPEHWVLNASPLITLARIGQERLFLTLTDKVVVPSAVAKEIQAGPEDYAREVISSGRFTIVDTPPPSHEIIAWDLGAGEAAVLALALAEQSWTAILDDAIARKCARSLSLNIKGTLAVVILAKQKGLIASAAEVIRSLRANGFRLDDQTIRSALKRTIGEEWIP